MAGPSQDGAFVEALTAFLAECPKVGKTKTATVPMKAGGSYRYKYADLGDVTDAAYPILAKHGLLFTTGSRMTSAGKYELVGRLRHVSGGMDEDALPLFGNSPQEIGSSITYARRYLLGMMTGLVTDEDTDAAGASHEPTRGQEPPPPADPLSEARGEAWRVWINTRPIGSVATATEFEAVVEEWTAQPFLATTPEQFRKFSGYLTTLGEVKEGQQP